MGVIAEALSQGIAVPKELAVIGCGNLHYFSEIRVPLSSIDQRSGEIGHRAARLILDILSANRCAAAGLPRNHPAAAPGSTRVHCPEQPCRIEAGSPASQVTPQSACANLS